MHEIGHVTSICDFICRSHAHKGLDWSEDSMAANKFILVSITIQILAIINYFEDDRDKLKV